MGRGRQWGTGDAMSWLLPALLRAQRGRGMPPGQAAGAKEGWDRVVSAVTHQMEK